MDNWELSIVNSLRSAFYRHPAFFPHAIMLRFGVRRFWVRNMIFAIGTLLILTLAVALDRSFTIEAGYGFLEHPGPIGWFLIQLVMPIVVYERLIAIVRSKKHYAEIVSDNQTFTLSGNLVRPIVEFVAFKTGPSRTLFAFLFLIGFSAFAWNTFQNLFPGELARLDFWDSIHFPFGYWTSRFWKFYTYALLLPSLAHVFAAIVWVSLALIRSLARENHLRLSPLNPDGCGGFGFLSEIVLSPTIWALLISALAVFGVIYTHGQFDVAVATGVVLQAVVLIVFYGVPTMVIRGVIVQAKKAAKRNIYVKQEGYYSAILAGRLKGASLRDAHEYVRHFGEIGTAIDKVSNWPHFSKMSWIFGLSISPALLSLLGNLTAVFRKAYLGLP